MGVFICQNPSNCNSKYMQFIVCQLCLNKTLKVLFKECLKVEVKSLSGVRLSSTTWTVAYQASLSMGFPQARILEWVAISFSRGSSWPRNWTWVFCITGRLFTTEPSGKPRQLNTFLHFLSWETEAPGNSVASSESHSWWEAESRGQGRSGFWHFLPYDGYISSS